MLLKKEILENNRTLKEKNKELKEEIERLNNIIKEVREKTKENQEYLESAKEMYLEQDDELLKIHTVQLINNNLSQNDDILEILDKDITKKSNYNYEKVEENKE